MAKQKINGDQLGPTGGVWKTWTPTFTGTAVGNGTLNAVYAQVGKTVYFRVTLTLGSTSSFASSADTMFTAPVTVSTTAYNSINSNLGSGSVNAGTTFYQIYPAWYSSTQILLQSLKVSGSNVINMAVDIQNLPSVGNGSILFVQGFYEAA